MREIRSIGPNYFRGYEIEVNSKAFPVYYDTYEKQLWMPIVLPVMVTPKEAKELRKALKATMKLVRY